MTIDKNVNYDQKWKLDDWVTPFGRSIPIALVLPVIVWIIIASITGEAGDACFAIFLGGLIHLVCYLVVGSIFYSVFWPKPKSIVWKFYIALPLGFALGYLPFLLCYLLSDPLNAFKSDNFYIGCIGGVYGLISAFSSVWVRWRGTKS